MQQPSFFVNINITYLLATAVNNIKKEMSIIFEVVASGQRKNEIQWTIPERTTGRVFGPTQKSTNSHSSLEITKHQSAVQIHLNKWPINYLMHFMSSRRAALLLEDTLTTVLVTVCVCSSPIHMNLNYCSSRLTAIFQINLGQPVPNQVSSSIWHKSGRVPIAVSYTHLTLPTILRV